MWFELWVTTIVGRGNVAYKGCGGSAWPQDSASFATQIVFRICGPSIPSYTLFIPKKGTTMFA
jgi:hypothetical protein